MQKKTTGSLHLVNSWQALNSIPNPRALRQNTVRLKDAKTHAFLLLSFRQRGKMEHSPQNIIPHIYRKQSGVKNVPV